MLGNGCSQQNDSRLLVDCSSQGERLLLLPCKQWWSWNGSGMGAHGCSVSSFNGFSASAREGKTHGRKCKWPRTPVPRCAPDGSPQPPLPPRPPAAWHKVEQPAGGPDLRHVAKSVSGCRQKGIEAAQSPCPRTQQGMGRGDPILKVRNRDFWSCFEGTRCHGAATSPSLGSLRRAAVPARCLCHRHHPSPLHSAQSASLLLAGL